MLGYSELLGSTELSNDQRALTDKISLQARRIRTLVASLLSFAKQAPAAKSDLDVNVVVQTALKLCQPQMQAAHVQSSLNMGGVIAQGARRLQPTACRCSPTLLITRPTPCQIAKAAL